MISKFSTRKWITPADYVDKSRGRPGSFSFKSPNVNYVPTVLKGSAEALPKNVPFAAAKYSIQKPIARWVLGGEGGASGSANIKASIYTPSNRLRISVIAACESDNQSAGDPGAGDASPTWVIQAVSRNPETGRESLLRQVYPASGTKVAPDGYEADTAAMQLRVDFGLTDFAAAAPGWLATATRGTLILIVSWEPNTLIDKEELRELYNKCSIAYGTPKLMQNNAP